LIEVPLRVILRDFQMKPTNDLMHLMFYLLRFGEDLVVTSSTNICSKHLHKNPL